MFWTATMGIIIHYSLNFTDEFVVAFLPIMISAKISSDQTIFLEPGAIQHWYTTCQLISLWRCYTIIFTSQQSRANYYYVNYVIIRKPEFFRDIILGGGFPYQRSWLIGVQGWWFGFRLDSRKWKGLLLRGIPNHRAPNHYPLVN